MKNNEIAFDIDFIRSIYKLQYIKRYNTWQRINNESVAEHSFYVVLFANRICQMLELPDNIKLTVMELCMIHDTPEIVINDITYDAKCAMPEIIEILDKYESKYFEENFNDIFNKKRELSDLELELVRNILKMADCMSAIQYCDNEIELGNNRFIQIFKEASLRYEKYHVEVKRILCEILKEEA